MEIPGNAGGLTQYIRTDADFCIVGRCQASVSPDGLLSIARNRARSITEALLTPDRGLPMQAVRS